MYKEYENGVLAPLGYVASGVHANIKASNSTKKDIALIYSFASAKVGGIFTTNKFAAAPVGLCREVVKTGTAQAILCNSGCANACTGELGLNNAKESAKITAEALEIDEDLVLIASTGVIGQHLPMDKMTTGIKDAVAALSHDTNDHVTEAIMTTDTYPKTTAISYNYEGREVTIGGVAKGSGMIHPNMATMLSFITTDANITSEALQKAVEISGDLTFNMVTVDGDTSTNDTLLVLANGFAENTEITLENGFDEFCAALTEVTKRLAIMMAHDGEGATKQLTATIKGMSSYADAKMAAKAIVSSSLVKSAFFGEDANWGRIVCALGYSGAEFETKNVRLSLSSEAGEILMMENGTPIPFSEDEALKILQENKINIDVIAGEGEFSATAWGCDLTYDYVKINGDYRT